MTHPWAQTRRREPKPAEWSEGAPEGRIDYTFDRCPAKLGPRPDCVREARCRRQARRCGMVLVKHMRTGLFMLDWQPGWTLDEIEAMLFGHQSA
jgi:hypothetical protein